MLTRFLRRNVYWLLLVGVLLMIIQYQTMRLSNAHRPIMPAPIFVAENQNLSKLVTVKFDAVPLQKVLNQWASETGITFNTCWPAFKKNDVDPDTPVTLKFDQPVKLMQALEILKGQLALQYDIDGSQVELSTDEELANRRVKVVLYPIHDLIVPQDLKGSSPEENRERLERLIYNSTDPKTWTNNGGMMGSIRPYGDLLAVSALNRTHVQIAQLLDTLRANPEMLGNPK